MTIAQARQSSEQLRCERPEKFVINRIPPLESLVSSVGLERTPTSRPCLTAHVRYTNLVCPISKAPAVVIAAEGQPPSLLLSLLHRNQFMPPELIEETANVLCRKHDTAKCQEFGVAELQHFLLCPACSRRGSLHDSMCSGGNR